MKLWLKNQLLILTIPSFGSNTGSNATEWVVTVEQSYLYQPVWVVKFHGIENRNAKVEVQFSSSGESTCEMAMPWYVSGGGTLFGTEHLD